MGDNCCFKHVIKANCVFAHPVMLKTTKSFCVIQPISTEVVCPFFILMKKYIYIYIYNTCKNIYICVYIYNTYIYIYTCTRWIIPANMYGAREPPIRCN